MDKISIEIISRVARAFKWFYVYTVAAPIFWSTKTFEKRYESGS